jgi:hypothetical protein
MYVAFDAICDSIDLRDAAHYYGVETRNGMTRCFSDEHADKKPSMKLYGQNYYCFGCGSHGDVINFTCVIFNLDYYAAAIKLCRDFGLIAEKSKEPQKLYVPKKNLYAIQENQINEAFRLLFDYRNYLRDCKERYKPKVIGEELHPQFVEYLTNLPQYEYYIESLLTATRDSQLRYISDNQAMFDRIAVKVSQYEALLPAEYENSANFILREDLPMDFHKTEADIIMASIAEHDTLENDSFVIYGVIKAVERSNEEKGYIDMSFIADKLGKTYDETADFLREQGLVYMNIGNAQSQDKTYVTAEEYLSGDLDYKLEQAKTVADIMPEFSVNVIALEKAIRERAENLDNHYKFE